VLSHYGRFGWPKAYRTLQPHGSLETSCCALELPSAQITELLAERNRSRILFQKWVLWKKEADETIYWMELLIEAEIVNRTRIASLLDEADQILSIVVTSIKTARGFKRPIRSPQSAI
jgi:hypothetical protein